jgi:hypothetical protein
MKEHKNKKKNVMIFTHVIELNFKMRGLRVGAVG